MDNFLEFISKHKNINFKFASEIKEYDKVTPKTKVLPYLFEEFVHQEINHHSEGHGLSLAIAAVSWIGSSASFLAIACSRAPLPTTRTFIGNITILGNIRASA